MIHFICCFCRLVYLFCTSSVKCSFKVYWSWECVLAVLCHYHHITWKCPQTINVIIYRNNFWDNLFSGRICHHGRPNCWAFCLLQNQQLVCYHGYIDFLKIVLYFVTLKSENVMNFNRLDFMWLTLWLACYHGYIDFVKWLKPWSERKWSGGTQAFRNFADFCGTPNYYPHLEVFFFLFSTAVVLLLC